MAIFKVVKTIQFLQDMDDMVLFIAQDNVVAALELEQHIHGQVDKLADPNFPRRLGRLPGTLELVAHPNYIVLLEQTDTAVSALALMHVARQYP